MKKPRYEYFDRAIVRTPLFPLEALKTPEEYLASKEFEEAIKIASPELSRAKESGSKDKEKIDKAQQSLYKYFLRSSTRCTPFGLFAGCTLVSVDEENTVAELSPTDKYRRCTRLDMQYLCALIQSIENNPDVRPHLRFYPNDSLYPIAGQFRYVEYHYKNTHRTHQISSIGRDEYIEIILNAAKEGLKPSELVTLLVNDEITFDDALEFVNELINNQVLKSELDPAVVGADVLSTLISKLQNIAEKDILPKLVEIQSLLSDIDSKPVGETTNLYETIIELIKSIGVGYEAKFLFQTDMFKPVADGGVSNVIVEEVRGCLTFLSNLNRAHQNENLQKFKRDFFERYESEEIPLAVALDGELGIGYPIKNNNDVNKLVDDLMLPFRPSEENRVSVSAVDLILLKKHIEATKRDDKVIYVDGKDFQSIDHASEDVYPDTCATMCSVMKTEDGNPVIFMKSAGPGAANLLGRFCHIDHSIDELVRQITAFEGSRKPDSILAEISHLPESRIGNISSRPALRDMTIHYLSNVDDTTKRRIDIPDLFLSVKNDRLYLRSKQLNKEIVPRLTCAHNFSIAPIPIYRFLCDMQIQCPVVRFHLQWGELFNEFEYLPRIQYKNVILSRQRWSIKKEELKECYKMSDTELLSFFESFVERRKLVRHVVLPEGDNEMYIDLKDIKCVKLLLSIVSKRTAFIVYECLFSEYDSVVTSGVGHYANEVLLAFHK